jgi:hypothetical protein
MTAAAAPPPDLAAARRFLQATYAPYTAPGCNGPRLRTAAEIQRVFTAEFVAAIRRNTALGRTEVPPANYDFLINAQDCAISGFAIALPEQATSPMAATVTFQQRPPEQPYAVLVTLVRRPSGWRIQEVGNPAEPQASLRAALRLLR